MTLRGTRTREASDKRRIVDETSRKRRLRKIIELLESDNYHDDPHADLVMSKKIPKFDDNLEQQQRTTRTKKRNVHRIIIRINLGKISNSWWKRIALKQKKTNVLHTWTSNAKNPICHHVISVLFAVFWDNIRVYRAV